MARASRARRVHVAYTDDEHAELARRAAAHGMTVSAYVRARTLAGYREHDVDPDVWWSVIDASRKGQVQAWLAKSSMLPPDAWWDTLDAARKAQVHGWLVRHGATLDRIGSQGALALFEE